MALWLKGNQCRGRVFQREESTVKSIKGYPLCKQQKLPFDGRGRVLLADSRKGLFSTETVLSRRSESKTRKLRIRRVDKGCCK